LGKHNHLIREHYSPDLPISGTKQIKGLVRR
jgi:hypothetical protein